MKKTDKEILNEIITELEKEVEWSIVSIDMIRTSMEEEPEDPFFPDELDDELDFVARMNEQIAALKRLSKEIK